MIYLFIFYLKEMINFNCFLCLFSLSTSFCSFRMDGHLYTMLHSMDMKNVLNYWFKMVQMFTFKTRYDFLFFICFWKINQFNCFIFSFHFISLIFFLFFSLEVHLFILLHQKGTKNVLSYWFKMVQMLIFKTRCDFLFLLFERINQF